MNGGGLDAGLLAGMLLDELHLVADAPPPSARTCAAACWPSPGSRCRRRRHGSRHSSHCRRPRPTAASAAPAWPALGASPAAPLRHRRRSPGRPRPRRARSARYCPQSTARAAAPWRSAGRGPGGGASRPGRAPDRSTVLDPPTGSSAPPAASARCPSQRCLLSSPSDCFISSTKLLISVRMAVTWDRG